MTVSYKRRSSQISCGLVGKKKKQMLFSNSFMSISFKLQLDMVMPERKDLLFWGKYLVFGLHLFFWLEWLVMLTIAMIFFHCTSDEFFEHLEISKMELFCKNSQQL